MNLHEPGAEITFTPFGGFLQETLPVNHGKGVITLGPAARCELTIAMHHV